MSFEKLNKERVMISICEVFHNNTTSVAEIPDFRRSWDTQDELFKNPNFPKKNIYAIPSNVEAYIESFPADEKKRLLQNNRGLYTIMYLHYEKAMHALERFEGSFGKIDEFFKGVPSQMAAFTLYTFHRHHCKVSPDELKRLLDKNWSIALKTDTNLNFEFKKEEYEMYRDVIYQRFDDFLNQQKIQADTREHKPTKYKPT